MEFRRNGMRDERRRRVLIDETLHGDESRAASTEESAGDNVNDRVRGRPYSDAALASTEVPISFFLPKRPLLTWTILLSGVALIGVIQLLYRFVFLAAAESLRPSLVAFDVTARGSLASWFAGVVLAVSALGSLLVYHIRRHRTDDYRGRYRLWLWLMPLLLMFSVCATTGLHQVVSGVLTAASGAEVAVGGKGWWLLAYGALLVLLVPQFSLEIWPSRMATGFFVVTLIAYVVVALFELHVIHLADPLATTMCHTGLLSTAHLGLLVTILAYGRYVYLDAHGRLVERKKWMRWPKRKKKSPAESNGEEPADKAPPTNTHVRIDEPHSKFGQETPTPRGATIQRDPDDEAVSVADKKLSKAERRKLRRDNQAVVNSRSIR